MGANTRTYKFSLCAALLDLATSGRDAVPLVAMRQTAVVASLTVTAYTVPSPSAI